MPTFAELVVQLKLQAKEEGLVAEVRTAAAAIDGLGDAAKTATNGGAKGANKLGKQTKLATDQVGKLTDRFNEIGVMMAVGRSPLKAIIQQGTEITQVIGPLGAGGAAGALKSAFLSMINPVSLITIGSIAAGTAMIQWLTSASEKGETLDDVMKQLAQHVKAYTAAAKSAGSSTADMADGFGSASKEARTLMRNMALIERGFALEKLRESAKGLKQEFDGLFSGEVVSQTGVVMLTEVAATAEELGVEFGLTQSRAENLAASLIAINQAETPEQAVQSASHFSDVLLEVFDNADGIPLKLSEIAQAAAEVAKAGGAIIAQDEAGQRSVEAMLATLKEENTLRWAAVQFGEDSVEVEVLRAAAARKGMEETLAASDAAEGLKDEFRASFEWGLQLAGMDISGGISTAADEAARLAGNLANARNARVAKAEAPLTGGNMDFFDPRNESGLSGVKTVIVPSPQNNSGDGGGGARASAQKTFAELIASSAGVMSGLELAIAAVNEKVAAGLLSTAEGQQAIDRAITGAAGSIGDLIPQLERAADTAGPDAAAKIEAMRKSLKGLVGDLKGTSKELSNTFSDSLGQNLSDFQTGAKSSAEAFTDFGNTVLNQINRIIAQRFTQRFITPLVDSLLSFLPAGLGGGAASGHGAGGSVPDIVTRPGNFAGGAAIRAIGAASRGAASGRGPAAGGQREAAPVNITVTNTAGDVAQASARETGSGQERMIEVMIEKVEAGVASNMARGVGPVAGVMASTFGLARQPR